MARLNKGIEQVKIGAPIDRMLGSVFQIAVEIAPEVFACAWAIRHAEGSPFIVGDTPVAMYDPTLNRHAARGNGWTSSQLAQTTLPLGRSTCLMIRPAGPYLSHGTARPGLVDEINLRTYVWADQYVYGPEHAPLEALHTGHSRNRPRSRGSHRSRRASIFPARSPTAARMKTSSCARSGHRVPEAFRPTRIQKPGCQAERGP
jgi:hypothetical protein